MTCRGNNEQRGRGDAMGASRVQTLVLLLISLDLPKHAVYGQQPHDGSRKVAVITIQGKPATITQQYACRINARQHIEVRAPEDGYLQEISVKEGQAVK